MYNFELSNKQIRALNILETSSKIPFTISDTMGQICYAFPSELTEILNTKSNVEFDDNLGKSNNPDAVSILEYENQYQLGICKINKNMFIATLPVRFSNTEVLHLSMFRKLSREDSFEKLMTIIASSPIVSHTQLVQYLTLVKYICTDEYPDKGCNFYRTYSDRRVEKSETKDPSPDFDVLLSNEYYVNNSRENDICEAICSGNIERLKEILRIHPLGKYGVFSTDALKNEKYTFVHQIRVYAETVISKGLIRSDILALTDSWCQYADMIGNVAGLHSFKDSCLIKLCTLMQTVSGDKNLSQYTKQAIVFIKQHLYEDVSVNFVSENIGVSRSTLSKYFIKEMGLPISQYVINEKLQEAATLLKTTDIPLLVISDSLNFASQSYFTKLFKEHYGRTPKDFRNH